jgi:phage baseplate assembly protein V
LDRITGPFTEQQHSVFRTGVVSSLESVPPYRVRVQFPDRDNIVSWWLPVLVPKIQDDKFFWQPDVGEQVAVLMDENDENGCVVGSVPSQVDQAPSGLTPSDFYIAFEDGTIIQYNRQTHQLQIMLGSGGAAVLSQPSGGSVELDSSGNVEIQAASSVSLSQGGASASDALALVSKLVAAFNAHTHGGVQTGGGTSATPTTPWTATTIESTLVKASN